MDAAASDANSNGKDKFQSELKVPKFKVHTMFTADQISIVLKAADQTSLLRADSLSAVFRAIGPFLSSKEMQELSWKSLRGKAYSIENRDKDIAIHALEELIETIKKF